MSNELDVSPQDQSEEMKPSQKDLDRGRWRSRVLLLALALGVLGWSLGFSLPVLLLALGIVTLVVLLVLPGRHVVVVIPGERSGTRASADRTDEQPAPTPPAPFKRRLARYLHCDVNHLNQARSDQKSKMKFWSAVAFGPRHSPKPAWFIRRLLERIRELVHG